MIFDAIGFSSARIIQLRDQDFAAVVVVALWIRRAPLRENSRDFQTIARKIRRNRAGAARRAL